jgi:hypothetical protein
MQYKVAKVEDIEAVLALHRKYQVDTIKEEDKIDGFVTTAFTKEELHQLITQEHGLFIAVKDDEVMAYVMSASWAFWSKWSMFAFMIEDLKNCTYHDVALTTENSYQYGPICIDKSVRGSGVLEKIFTFALEKMSSRFEYLVTFVNKKNPRSFEAHKRKLGLKILKEFEYNGNEYYEFVRGK